MKKCIIAEKPSLAMTIKNSIYESFTNKDGYFESNNYIITFGFGHLFELWSIEDYLKKDKPTWNLEELPYIPEEFKFKLKSNDGIEKQFNIIKELVNRNDVTEIVHCGDSDREGQLIVNLILNSALKNSKSIYRLWLPEQTEDTIRENMKNMPKNSEYENLYNEGFLRTVVDNLLGVQYTRYISILAKKKLPVGRVLIPIVKAVYDRDMEINNFKSQDFYSVKGTSDDKAITFTAFKTDKNLPINTQKELATNYIKHLYKQAEVISLEEKEITKRPKKLFSLDTLQNKLSKEHKIKPTDTLKALQNLYQNGYVTYPRTNTEYLSANEKEKINKILNLLKAEHNVAINDSTSIFDSSKVESHSAITITTKSPDVDSLTKNEKLVYEIIKNRFISNFLVDKTIITETTMILEIGKDIKVEIKGKAVKEQGYLKYENDVKDTILPNLKLNQKISINYTLELSKTKPKAHLNTEELNKYLKNPFKSEFENADDEYKYILEGVEIGTVATRGIIIDNAIEYGYIEFKKDSYYITDIGIKLIELLDTLHIDLYKNRTVELSKMLKKVFRKEQSIEDGVQLVKEILEHDIKKDVKVDAIKTEKEIIGKCPRCEKNIYESEKSFYCEGYKDNPKCEFVLWKENKFFTEKGKKVTKAVASKFLKDKVVIIKGLKKKDGKGEYNAKIEMVDTVFNNQLYVNFKILEFVK
jgi:DNA topoisomerase III